jgi:hypothetical protein
MPAALDVRSLDAPIVQAGMGAVARHELAAAVSEAGGLGTIAGARAPIAAEIAAAHRLTGRPIAVNLLLPFVRSGDAEASAAADVIVTFWGTPRRLAANTWIHQCGSVEEATAAAAAGADAVIAQGVEAGGHVRGTTPMLELLERVRAAVKIPVLAAGGIIDAEGVRAARRRRRCRGCRHTLLAERRKPRPSRLQAALPRRLRDDPDRAVRARMARSAASSDPQRRDAPLAARRPPWSPMDPGGEPSHRSAREPDPTVVQDRAIGAQRPSQPPSSGHNRPPTTARSTLWIPVRSTLA